LDRTRIFALLLFLMFAQICFAQTQHTIPLIKATSKVIAIKDGDQLRSDNWDYLSVTHKPVIYNISKINKNRRLVFYTDIDSISFNISPNKKYAFKVLLHSTDTCYAEISTIIPSYFKNCDHGQITNDTIPFTLGTDQYIHIKGNVNNSKTLDFIYDTGASCVLLTESGVKKAKIKFDGVTKNQGSGGSTIEQTSSSNHLQLSKLEWEKLPILYIDYKGGLHADGVIGFNVFEDKVVEIDYNKSMMIIHSHLTMNKTGYTKIQMRHDNNGSLIQAILNNGKKDCNGWFLLDTGGNLTVAVNGGFAKANNLYGTMKKLGNSKIGGTGKNVMDSETDELPGLKLSDYIIPNVPVLLQGSEENLSQNAGIIGNSILKRFNMLIDYPDATIYLKPNSLFQSTFERIDKGIKLVIYFVVLTILLIGFRTYLKRK